jgi:type VI secretion system protein ImpA
MSTVEELLMPVSSGAPCGEDLTYDPAFGELQRLLQGKPETQFSPAEDPDWRQVRASAETLSARTKDLRVATTLCLAWLKERGVVGFRDGTALIRGLLVRYWAELYPRLDPDDNNDPTERVSILSALTTPLGTFGDPLRFIEHLLKAPLTDSRRAGSFNLTQIQKALAPEPPSEPGIPSAPEVQAAFRDTDPAVLQGVSDAVTEAKDNIKAIDAFLAETIGANRSLAWTHVLATLDQIQKAVLPHIAGISASVEQGTGTESASSPVETVGGDGAIRSRTDVVNALERICEYYARSEPSSPLPFLLRRAQRLVEMNFLDIINDLTPETLAALRVVVGVRDEKPPGSTT